MKLKDFLLSDKTTLVKDTTSDTYKDSLSKMIDKDNNIIYIYRNMYNKGNIFNPFDFDTCSLYACYSQTNNTFYFLDKMQEEYSYLDLSDLNISSIDKLKLEIENKINAIIVEKIENDETKLNINLDNIKLALDEDIEYTAKRKLASSYDKKVDMNSYAKFNANNIKYNLSLYISYMNDDTLTVLEEAYKYIEENKEEMYLEINKNKRVQACIESLKKNPDYELMLKLNDIFHNDCYKTLNITYKKDGNKMAFKINNEYGLDSPSDSLSSSKIVSVKDRDSFEGTFKSDGYRYPNIEPEYIESITYGRNVLYKKNA